MCLLKVNKIYNGTSKRVKTGYKVFEYTTEGLLSFIVPSYGILPKGKWLDEKEYRLESCRDEDVISIKAVDYALEYPMGWHVFTEIDDAKLFALLRYEDEDEVIYKVQCKGILAKGVDTLGKKVEVYKYIKISYEMVWAAWWTEV